MKLIINSLILFCYLFPICTIAQITSKEQEKGFEVLFDGTSLEKWTGNTTEYVLEDGCIVMKPVQEMGGNFYTKEEYDDFVLRFEFQLTVGANNGLGIRHDMVDNEQGYSGMELQILDNEDPQYQDLKPYQYHGSVYGIIPAKRGYLKPVGEWNEQEVIAKGNKITVILNGVTILDGDLLEATKNLSLERFSKAVFNKKGHIAFLGHGSEIKFKNIRIKPL